MEFSICQCYCQFVLSLEVSSNFFSSIASTKNAFLQSCAMQVVVFLFSFCSEESMPVCKPVPTCVYPFTICTVGGVVVFIYCINQADLQQPYIFLLNGFKLTWGIITSQLMWFVISQWLLYSCYLLLLSHWAISRSSQCSMTGVPKAVVCVILSVGWCI